MEGMIAPLFRIPLKHVWRLITDRNYREYCWLVSRYGRRPRYQTCTLKVRGNQLQIPDMASFLSAFREIFVEEIYAFASKKRDPKILDCGANIGLSVLYFKERFPDSKLTAFEADPAIFEILRKNVTTNGLNGVELINKAIWSTDAVLEFSVEGADGGRVNVANDGNLIKVPAVSLSSLLRDDSYEFIKIDIEGAEVEALRGCSNGLNRQNLVFVEFHSFKSRPQGLSEILTEFENAGFRVHVHPPYTSTRPFLGIDSRNGMDMQLNLFFWKDRRENA